MINFKIVLIGDAGVGKTAIVHRFKYNTFVERHASTIGVDFTIKTMQVDDKKVKVCEFSVYRVDLDYLYSTFFTKLQFSCVSHYCKPFCLRQISFSLSFKMMYFRLNF